jgi:ribosome-binding factor A
MPREFQRAQRLSQQVHRLLGQMLREEVRDPRVGFVTITEVRVARDLSHAKVYFSLLDPSVDLDGTTTALRSAAGFLRSRLGEQLQSRTVPQLDFVYDETTERAARMEELLRSLDVTEESPDSH